MATSLEDILSAICSSVETQPSNDFQNVFLLGDAKEARLAFDVLVAHGFDAKIYPENGVSRLYVNRPGISPAQAEKKLATALAYARSLRDIKQSLDTLRSAVDAPDYHVSFVNNPTHGGHISIHLSPVALPAEMLPPVESTQRIQAVSVAAVAPAAQAVKKKKKAYVFSKPAKTITSGPEIAKQPLFHPKKPTRPDSFRQQMVYYVTGNSAMASYIVISVALTMLIIYSLFVVSKGYFCRDAVVSEKNKNPAWYCQ